MKVLKAGRPQQGWSKKVTCTGSGNGGGGCGALLLVEAGDVFKRFSEHYDGSSETYYEFKCPQCGVISEITEVPTAVKSDALSYDSWKKARDALQRKTPGDK